jgi:hypothetical protein
LSEEPDLKPNKLKDSERFYYDHFVFVFWNKIAIFWLTFGSISKIYFSSSVLVEIPHNALLSENFNNRLYMTDLLV